MKTNQSIKELYDQLYAQKYISANQVEIDDLAIDIDVYKAGVMGFTSQYLHGLVPPIDLIKVESELALRMDNVVGRITLLQVTLEKTFELARMLQEELRDSETRA